MLALSADGLPDDYALRETLPTDSMNDDISNHLTEEEYPTNDEGYPLVPEGDVIGVFPRDTGWGWRISFEDYDNRRVSGHLSPRPEAGDLFAYQLESGRVGVFRLVDLDYCLNPDDMFFADVEDIGYLSPIDPPSCSECGSSDAVLFEWETMFESHWKVECNVCGHAEKKTKEFRDLS